MTRFVWAGDNLLWELKQADGSMAAAAGGNVSYFHAGGIDRPLVITKDGQSIIPHQNWRGQFARGTYPNGTRSDCTSCGCTPIQWPGERTSARHELEPDGNIQNWFGGLVDGMRDASGQMYMRNRYYDPATGQFTQTDPIGLAGGLNAYGFAAGDPVSYSDPYGLCPRRLRTNGKCPGGLSVSEWEAVDTHRQYMSREASNRTRGLLTAGKIRGADLPSDVNGVVGPDEPGIMYINRTFSGETSDGTQYAGSIFGHAFELGKTVTHEGKHIDQLRGKAAGQEAGDYIQQNGPVLEQEAYDYEKQNYRRPVQSCTRSGACAVPN